MQIKRTKLYEVVVENIVESVKKGQIKCGEKIPSEKELAKEYGVSRMAIREALSALESAGVIEVKHGLGIFVKDINEEIMNPITQSLLTEKESLLNILELRIGLETEGAYLAAMRASEEQLQKLESALRLMKEEIARGGTAAIEDFEFHSILIEATGNPIYIKVFETIANIFYEGLKTSHNIIKSRLGPRLVIGEEHQIILDHIKSKQPEKARQSMREHLTKVRKTLTTILPDN